MLEKKDSSSKTVVFHPIINGLQKMALYKTKSFFYIIGSDATQTIFRVLKIDRTEPTDLILHDDEVEYSPNEIKSLIAAIHSGNKSSSKYSSSLFRSASAFGIFGFIRFHEGYYMILITKRRKVAAIGYHSIYKIEDTTLIYIPHDTVRIPHDDEQKYVKLFGNIDLTSNFYFSYSYDLSNSFQYNFAPFSEKHLANAKKNFGMYMSGPNFRAHSHSPSTDVRNIGYRNIPNKKFIWNSYLIKPMEGVISSTWIVPVIHGFIDQSNICVHGRSFYFTLIARRSAYYAGTRFLKRGTNFEGDAANEVETEQILHDAHISNMQHARFSSFVQIRGSIPCHWSQDVSKMVPKPPIHIDIRDPYAEVAGQHFNKLLRRFGSPIMALNLVKRREKKPHESILSEEYSRLIQQLNITLPPKFKIQHLAVDMARINKDKEESVMSHLADIAYKTLCKTGFFLSKGTYYTEKENPNIHFHQIQKIIREKLCSKKFFDDGEAQYQTGVVRVNCVDCLDRTNTAQFALGKCALGFQFYALGVLPKPFIEYDTDSAKILERMYEDHGDTLALQYGGSQLVHRIETYRKTAAWTSQGSDFMQSLSRYYSNTFSDQEKQNAINLFLGVYIPSKCSYPVWDLQSDYILHQSLARDLWPCHWRSTSQWWDSDVMKCLPYPADLYFKTPEILEEVSPYDAKIDLFGDHYRPFELSSLTECFHFNMNHSVRDVMPPYSTNESPFCVRKRPDSKQENQTNLSNSKKMVSRDQKSNVKSPSLSGQPSTGSTTSSISSIDSQNSDDDFLIMDFNENEVPCKKQLTDSPWSFFPSVEEYYGDILKPPGKKDMEIYKEYLSMDRFLTEVPSTRRAKYTQSENILETISKIDEVRSTYENYVSSTEKALLQPPDHNSLLKYQEFCSYR